MTILRGTDGDSTDVRSEGRTASQSLSGMGRVPELALAMAAGAALIAIAFAGARYGRQWATHVYWLGQIVIYASPAAFLLLRKRVMAIEATAIAILMPVTTFLINQYYAPGQFRFLDEFEHVQTAQTILATHHLFHVNTILPQSPQYPGLEIITTNIVSVTHLSITTAGLIVAGIAHVIVGTALYFLILEICARPRVAALSVVLYATGSHYQFFDSYFIYETVAIPFLILSLLATVKMMKSVGPAVIGWGGVAVASGAVAAVCHHVTSYALIANACLRYSATFRAIGEANDKSPRCLLRYPRDRRHLGPGGRYKYGCVLPPGAQRPHSIQHSGDSKWGKHHSKDARRGGTTAGARYSVRICCILHSPSTYGYGYLENVELPSPSIERCDAGTRHRSSFSFPGTHSSCHRR